MSSDESFSSSTVGNRWSWVYLPSKASIARVPEQLQWGGNSCEPALYVSHRWELKTYYVKPIEILELFITTTLTQTYCLYNYEVHSESINPACRRDLECIIYPVKAGHREKKKSIKHPKPKKHEAIKNCK